MLCGSVTGGIPGSTSTAAGAGAGGGTMDGGTTLELTGAELARGWPADIDMPAIDPFWPAGLSAVTPAEVETLLGGAESAPEHAVRTSSPTTAADQLSRCRFIELSFHREQLQNPEDNEHRRILITPRREPIDRCTATR